MSADLKVVLRYDGSALASGTRKTKSELESLAGAAKNVFGGLIAVETLRRLEQTWEQFEAGNAAMAKLEQSTLRLTGSAKAVDRAFDIVGATMRRTGRDDGELATALEMLTVKLGDADKAASMLNLTLDVAERFNLDLGQAVDVVAKAEAGQMKELFALLPQLREVVKETDALEGSAAASAKALAGLADIAGGALDRKLETSAGQIDRIKGLLGETKESATGFFARMVTGSDDTVSALKRIADQLQYMPQVLDSMKFDWDLVFAPDFSKAWRQDAVRAGKAFRSGTGAYGNWMFPPGSTPADQLAKPPYDWAAEWSRKRDRERASGSASSDPWWNRRGANPHDRYGAWDFSWMEPETTDPADDFEKSMAKLRDLMKAEDSAEEETMERQRRIHEEKVRMLQGDIDLLLHSTLNSWEATVDTMWQIFRDKLIAKAAAEIAEMLIKLANAGSGSSAPAGSPSGGGSEELLASIIKDPWPFSSAGARPRFGAERIAAANMARRAMRG